VASGARAPVLSQVAAETDRLIAAVWMPEWLEGPGAAVLEADPRVALFRSSDRAFEAIRTWFDWHEGRAREDGAISRASPAGAAAKARAILLAARAQGKTLTEQESKSILTAYGIVVPREMLAETPQRAARAAEQIGFPVAVKIASPDIPHKTEVGGIRLNLHSSEEVSTAAAQILSSARTAQPSARLNGVSVQAMVPAGHELVMGVRIDRQFGPLVMVGSGGIFVELLADAATALAPVSTSQAQRMLQRLRSYKLLLGYRGRPGYDVIAALDVLCRLAELASDLAEEIAEVDINPVIVGIKGAIAADALIVTTHNDDSQ
jgi:acetate---CoA ligase (ADP-forming)